MGLLVYTRWLFKVWQANEYDKKKMHHYRDFAGAAIASGVASPVPLFEFDDKQRSFAKSLRHWSMQSHLAIAAVLLAGAFLLLEASSARGTPDAALLGSKATEAASANLAENTKALLEVRDLLTPLRTELESVRKANEPRTIGPSSRK